MRTIIKILAVILVAFLFSCSQKINFTVANKYTLDKNYGYIIFGSIEKNGEQEKKAIFLRNADKFNQYKAGETYLEKRRKVKNRKRFITI